MGMAVTHPEGCRSVDDPTGYGLQYGERSRSKPDCPNLNVRALQHDAVLVIGQSVGLAGLDLTGDRFQVQADRPGRGYVGQQAGADWACAGALLQVGLRPVGLLHRP